MHDMSEHMQPHLLQPHVCGHMQPHLLHSYMLKYVRRVYLLGHL
jgi:hypothetical protein